jgi:hypothetical protein
LVKAYAPPAMNNTPISASTTPRPRSLPII